MRRPVGMAHKTWGVGAPLRARRASEGADWLAGLARLCPDLGPLQPTHRTVEGALGAQKPGGQRQSRPMLRVLDPASAARVAPTVHCPLPFSYPSSSPFRRLSYTGLADNFKAHAASSAPKGMRDQEARGSGNKREQRGALLQSNHSHCVVRHERARGSERGVLGGQTCARIDSI